jgi:hypothetical protein
VVLAEFFAMELAGRGRSLCFGEYPPLRQYRADMQTEEDAMRTRRGKDCYSKDFALLHSIKLRPAYRELARVIP